jgi:hypothetical protein
MARPPPSHAARGLAAAASTDELPLSARQIERWRQEELIDASHRVWPGRGKGSRSQYPPTAIEQAQAVARLVREGLRLQDIPLVLFARREPVRGQALRRSFVAYLTEVTAWLMQHTDDGDRFTAAETTALRVVKAMLARPRGRAWRRGLRSRPTPEDTGPETADSLLVSVLTNVLLVALTGEAASDEGLAEVLDAAGAQSLLNDAFAGIGPITLDLDLAPIGPVLERCSLDSLQRIAETAPLRVLDETRDFLADSRQFATDFTAVMRAANLPGAFGFAELAGHLSDIGIALTALVVIAARDILGDDLDAHHAMCRQEGPRFAALHRLIVAVPEAANLPTGVGPEVMAKINDYFAANPADRIAILGDDA